MPANYVLLGEVTVGSAGAASVTLSNIPQSGYTDLKIVATAKTDRASQVADWIKISFNGSTTSYSYKELEGTGSSVGSYSGSDGLTFFASAAAATANTFGNAEVYIPNYTSANHKSYSADSVTENNATSANTGILAGLWSNTAAITSINFTPNAGTLFLANSTFYLYGLAAVGTTPVIAPFASGGDIVTNDGTYWYHAFLSSGTFTANKSLNADCLVVAGGGAGGYNWGGGGGAGGVLYSASTSLSGATAYAATVGAGAAQQTVLATTNNGSNSTLIGGSISQTAIGGGGGGCGNTPYNAGNNGGSGGGGGNTSGAAAGSGTTGQGNAGGAATTGSNAGGGGGAGAVGQAGSVNQSGAGGAGTNSYSSWLSATALGVSGYIAGGGGGGGWSTFAGYLPGAGGSGGGTAGNLTSGQTTNVPATANTGSGGGGGAGANGYGNSGGSGIVIIRYPIA